MLCLIVGQAEVEESRRLFFLHPSAETFKAFVGGLFDEGHVFSEVLLGGDFAFLAPFELVKPELGDERPIFLVQFFPDLTATGLFRRWVLVTGWIGCPCIAPARSQ